MVVRVIRQFDFILSQFIDEGIFFSATNFTDSLEPKLAMDTVTCLIISKRQCSIGRLV